MEEEEKCPEPTPEIYTHRSRSVKEALTDYRSIDDSLEEDPRYSDQDQPSCWNRMKNDIYSPSFPSVESVPAGVYEIEWSSSLSSYVLKKQPFKTDELYHLPSPEIMDIVHDIETFWNQADRYKEYRFVHKRGILMFGDPGCGKSGIIQLISQALIDRDGIVINVKDAEDVVSFGSFIPTFRKIEPDRPIIVLLEDIDSIAGDGNNTTNRLLNILDGVKQIEGVVYIATTNYPERLQERITNRPSRFDRRYRIEVPDREIRRAYIQNKLTSSDLEKINIEDWLDCTDGMSLSHLKELVISVIVMDKDFNETIENLEGLKKSPRIKGSGQVGFSSK
jgi:SpoVK/Ycf46/Vps4 family AAA+-type ATPase